LFKTLATSFSAPARFALVIDGLYRAVAARIAARTITAALITLICGRLRRIDTQLQALIARFRAGTLRVVVATPRHAPVPPRPALPSGFGWLLPLVPCEAACHASQLRAVLAEPEMAALIAATPQAARLLRPLCRVLGLEPALLTPPANPATAASPVNPATAAPRTARPRAAPAPALPPPPQLPPNAPAWLRERRPSIVLPFGRKKPA